MSTTFSIAGQGLKLDTAADVAPHISKLKEIKGVKFINLSGNTIGVEASKALAEELKNAKDLEAVDFSDIFTGRLREEIPPSLDALLTSLLECKNLHTIDLSDNAFGIATIQPLEKFLAKHTPLEHLLINNNGFGPEAGSRIGLALEKLAAEKKEVPGSKPLQTVVCGRNRLENGSMEAWAKFLAAHGSITTIRIYQNGIRQEGVEHLLLNGLSKSPKLETLDLHDNTFTLQGTAALSKVLDKWDKIKEIAISDCLLSTKGGEVLGKALLDVGKLEHLESLKLQYNEIDQKGLELLKKAIQVNMPNLKVLELNGNRFSEDHEFIDEITALFEERGFGELDELDDMEEETDDEEDEEEEDEEDEEESVLKDADDKEDENVAPEKDAEVDELAEEIKKTSI